MTTGGSSGAVTEMPHVVVMHYRSIGLIDLVNIVNQL